MTGGITQESILSVQADAAVLCVENTMEVTREPVSLALEACGGAALRRALDRIRFIPVGSAVEAEISDFPFPHLFVTAAPHWLTGKANELLVLHRCYESLFSLADTLGLRRLALPFLSADYYRFPRAEAVRIALSEAGNWSGEALFVTADPALCALSREPYRRPQIVSYIGYYRDHALFELDNGLFARVDLRPERREVALIPYFEACYRVGNNPLQPPLPEEEIARLRRIYETTDW